MCLAVPGQILSTQQDGSLMRTGRVSFGGVIREISLAYVPEANVGDYVIVHAGFAISRINEEEAQKVFQTLDALGALEEATTAGTDHEISG